MTNKKFYFIFFLLALTLFYPALQRPFLDSDELFWGEFANSVVNGCAPYLCVLGEKPPLLYLFYTLIFKVFGLNQYFWVQVVHLSIIALNATLLSTQILKKKNLAPGIFYIFMQALPGFQMRSTTGESLMNPFLILGWIVLLHFFRTPKNWKLILFGILTGLASSIRHQAGIHLCFAGLSLLAFHYLEHEQIRLKMFLKSFFHISLLTLGFIAIWSIHYFWMSHLGIWDDYLFWGLKYSFGYIQSGQQSSGMKLAALGNLSLLIFSTGFILYLAIKGIKEAKSENKEEKLIKWTSYFYLFTALLATIPGTRFYRHYFIQCFPALAILATLGFEKIKALFFKRKILVFWATLTLVMAYGQNLFMAQTMSLGPDKDYNFKLFQTVGNYIQEHSSPKDKIQVWGWSQGIYLFSKRQIATRFISSDYLTGRVSASDPSKYSWQEAQHFVIPGVWDMFFEDLQKNTPLYFIDSSPSQVHRYQYFPPENYPKLKTYLDENYQLETILEEMKIYRRKENLIKKT